MSSTEPDPPAAPVVFTIGHSTRPIEEFVAILQAHGIELLADIRTIPKSARNPQFNIESLAKALPAAVIEYVHIRGLGGLRHARKDSMNSGWKNASFRGYADYMQLPEFNEHINKLIELAAEKRTAIMCAEAVPWRCHRSLVADALTARSIKVLHIMSAAQANPHKLTAFARVRGCEVTYPGAPAESQQKLPGLD